MNLNKPNGGFPPINIYKKNEVPKQQTKEKESKKYKQDNLRIKNILSESKVKPMIDIESKSKINIIDNL